MTSNRRPRPPRPDLAQSSPEARSGEPRTTSPTSPTPFRGEEARARSTAATGGTDLAHRGRSPQQKVIAAKQAELTALKASPKPCPQGCGAPVLMGRLDATQAEQPYVVDPAPLSNLGEALALLQGRTTYDHRRRGQQIEERDDFTVKGSPAETPGWYRAGSDVVAEHRCGTTPLPTIPSRLI